MSILDPIEFMLLDSRIMLRHEKPARSWNGRSSPATKDNRRKLQTQRGTVDLAERIRSYIETEEAERLLTKYYSGSYTGSLYDELESDEPNRITTDDIAAVALLSVELSGPAVKSLLWDHADAIAERLQKVPTTPLADIASEDELQPLWEIQNFFEQHISRVGIGHVRRSKLLAHKRRHLVPIRDRYVLQALVDGPNRPFTDPLRRALRDAPEITERLDALREDIGRPQLALIRVLDVVVWMTVIGDAQVPTRTALGD